MLVVTERSECASRGWVLVREREAGRRVFVADTKNPAILCVGIEEKAGLGEIAPKPRPCVTGGVLECPQSHFQL
jgi:hypothetical protein